MNDSGRSVTKTKSIDAMREVMLVIVEHWANVYVSSWEMQAFSSNNVKVASHFVQR